MIWLAIAIGLLIAAMLLLANSIYHTAHRLDRLHVRYDLSWQALDAALARRAVVARAVAVEIYGGADAGKRLAALADAAERAPRPEREACENQLSAALANVDPAALPPALVAEVADAEARVLLARRFHNDAVRDTRALGERPLVRLLRLGGTAPLPEYFEIVERTYPIAATATAPGAAGKRVSARVVLLDETGAVLLLCGSDPAHPDGAGPRWWFTVGGEVRPGERLSEAAARELAEETGLQVSSTEMVGPIWRRDAVFEFNGSLIDSQEFFFVYRTARFDPVITGRTELERRYIHCFRWCQVADIDGLTADGETVYPLQLSELLAEATTLADHRAVSRPPALQSIR